MKTRRKIWSMPIAALAVALMLATALIATGIVYAVATGTKISDQTLTVNNVAGTTDNGGAVEINLTDLDATTDGAQAAFTDPDGDALAYTAMTSDPAIADVTLDNTEGTGSAAIATTWWDALDGTTGVDCSKKATRLGFAVGTTSGNTAATNATAGDAAGLCRDYASLDPDDTDDTNGLEGQQEVLLAFHWDMLSGDEMVVAARAAGESDPNDYKQNFGGLSPAERVEVASWFDEDILAMGSGPLLTLVNDGRAYTTGTTTLDPAISDKAGTATITVKASDATGRLIPPGDGSATVGQSFQVKATLSNAAALPAFANNDGSAAGNSIIEEPADSGNLVVFTARTDDTAEYYSVRISPGSENIADIYLGGDTDLADPTAAGHRLGDYIHNIHQNPINFSLTNGGDVSFQIRKVDNATARIQAKPGVTLTAADSPYEFTVVANEYTRAPANSVEIDISVTVVLDNVGPVFDAPTSGSVPERAKNHTIATFTATDANNQALTYDIDEAASDAPPGILGSLELDESTGAAVLKTNSAVEDPDQPDFIEAVADDPETTADESRPEGDNEHVIVITATDGTVTTSHSFTLTITDTPDPARGVDLNFDVPEDTGTNGVIGEISLSGATGNYRISEQFNPGAPLADQRVAGSGSLFALVDKAGDSSTGVISLKMKGTIDFEDATPNDYILAVQADGAESDIVTLRVTDVNEAPKFSLTDKGRETQAGGVIKLFVLESAAEDSTVKIGKDSGGNPNPAVAKFTATDEDSAATGNAISYQLLHDADADGAMDDIYEGADAIVKVDSAGTILVNKALETDGANAVGMADLTLRAYDANDNTLQDTLRILVEVIDTNVAPEFTADSQTQTSKSISEDTAAGTEVFTYRATDADLEPVRFRLTTESDDKLFEVINEPDPMLEMNNQNRGRLQLKAMLDYETSHSHEVTIQVGDEDADKNFITVTINVVDVNDTPPVLSGPSSRSVSETTKPGTVIGTYTLTDVDTVGKPSLSIGANSDAGYKVERQTGDATKWDLKTTVWLDADTNPSDTVNLMASDGIAAHNQNLEVTITILDTDDSISNIYRSKANPLPGGRMGDPDAALADSPANYVATEWANWNTVLRIRVTNPSPDAACGADCVMVNLEADSADTSRTVKARRTLTQEKGNDFFAAVKLVEEYEKGQDADAGPGEMAYLKVDEEDEITIKFGNARKSVEVENEAPEIDNFMPAHESAFKDEDVDYVFTVTDDSAGIPDAEDLPDTDGDGDYTSVVALISRAQCDDAMGRANAAATLHNDRQIVCNGTMGVIDEGGDYEFRQIVDDKDFSDIDNGIEVETTIAFEEDNDRHYYVTFIACDAAGNCIAYDPDENDDDVALPRITVDTTAPKLEEARTGVAWDATDNKYDDSRSFVQVVFSDLTALNPDTVEVDDFLVVGHVIKAVHMFDPDDEETPWGDENDDGTPNTDTKPSRFAQKSLYQQIDRTVFLELEDELAPDEKPKVSILPNGVEDSAANEQDDADVDADDWIAPSFTVVSIVSPRETAQSEVLAGEDDRVVFTLTTDERLYSPRPTITITYVNAPVGCVETESGQTLARGEIETGGNCGASATGAELKYNIEKVSNTEWTITAKGPGATGYYNFHVEGSDRSSQRNSGSEGIAKDDIKKKFFAKNGDVSDDAHFFQGDVNLSKPMVRVSGEAAGDDEPTVELRSPLFVELDFTNPFSEDCENPADNRDNCIAESDEYAKDSYDSVTVTSFMLDGVDITDSVKTTDDETFLVAIDGIAAGAHEINIQAMDAAGNALDDTLDIEFEVEERDPFKKRLSPGWNLVSLPGEPADGGIAAVFGSDVEVRTVYTYDPVVPGGWMVAVREALDSDWQGDLMEISGQRGYWVLSDAIQDWEVSIPRLAGGAEGTGTPIQPPSIALYAGWNLIPVTDVTGDFASGISVANYLEDLGTAREIELARVLSFNTIRNEWKTLSAGDKLELGSGYWVFVRAPATLVPGN